MKNTRTLAIIGGGPSALFTLQHIRENVSEFRECYERIIVFEREEEAGPGMPYSITQTSPLNLSNISSEELPTLPCTLEEWLNAQDTETLEELQIKLPIKAGEIYPRVALGRYFKDQFRNLSGSIQAEGIDVEVLVGSSVADIEPQKDGGYKIVRESGEKHGCDTAVIATGHQWPKDEDAVNFASPWPIHKLLPDKGRFHDHCIGLLGASLSSIDVINVLVHHHGKFTDDGRTFLPDSGCKNFKLVMHSADGLLSHLQFEQDHPMRTLYRHCSESEVMALVDADGFLSLDSYFDIICRPVLVDALQKDGMTEEADLLSEVTFDFEAFTGMMKDKHHSPDPFGLMKVEYTEARDDIRRQRTTHWKEVLDDLMYTLNFHADLLAAEDHLNLRSEVLPFVMNVMAALPMKSAKILMAVHDAGRLEMVSGKAKIHHKPGEETVKVSVEKEDGDPEVFEYRMFVDSSGQSPVGVKEFPFKSICTARFIRAAVAPVREIDLLDDSQTTKVTEDSEGNDVVELGGLEVTEHYQLVSQDGNPVAGLYDIAVPQTAGLRPYCYGFQACDEAAKILVQHLSEAAGDGEPSV